MSNRYEREIEELLRKIEGLPPKKKWHEKWREQIAQQYQSRSSGWGRQGVKLTPGKMFLGSLILFLLAFWTRSNQGLAGLFLLVALGLFVYAYYLSFGSRGYPRVEKRWRGQSLDVPRQKPYPWEPTMRKIRLWWLMRRWRRRRW